MSINDHRCISTVSKTNLLIVTDSRGRGIDYELAFTQKICDCVQTTTEVIPGGNFKQLLQIAQAKDVELRRRGEKADYVIIAGGICSLTKKAAWPHPRARSILYDPKEDCVKKIIDNIDDARKCFGNNVNIATIPPASLQKYYKFMNGQDPSGVHLHRLEKQQVKLLQDLETINKHIIAGNINRNIETIDWNRKVQSASLKKRNRGKSNLRRRVVKFTDRELYDGVHATDKLQMQWFARLIEVTSKELKKTGGPLNSNAQIDSTSSDEEHVKMQWNPTTREYEVVRRDS